MTVRIITEKDYGFITGTCNFYRDASRLAQLRSKSLEQLTEYYHLMDRFDKVPGDVLLFHISAAERTEIRALLNPQDRDNPEAMQRFAGSRYFRAYTWLRTALFSAMAGKGPKLF